MYIVRKKRNEQCFCVKHAQTGDVHSEHATRKDALAQLRQLSVGGMPNTPFVPKHALFRSPAPARPPTPDFVPTPTMTQAERDQALDALAPSLSNLLYPAPARPASFSMTPSSHVRDVHISSHIMGFIADMEAGRPLPPSLQSIYNTLTKIKIGTPNKRVATAVALHNLGYGSEAIKNAKRTGQLQPLLAHIVSNFRTIIPATLGSGYGGMKRSAFSQFMVPYSAPEPIGPARFASMSDVAPATISIPQPSGGIPVPYGFSNVPAFIANTPQPLQDLIDVLTILNPRMGKMKNPGSKIVLAMGFYNLGWTPRELLALGYSKPLYKYVADNMEYIVPR